MTELKINTELISALAKLCEASDIFYRQLDERNRDYTEDSNTFNSGISKCIDIIEKMISEAAIKEMYRMMPNIIK